MVDIGSFVKSMKLSWLKRLMTSTAEWTYLATCELPNVQDVLMFGSSKLQKVTSKIKNPVWKDVVEAFSNFTQLYSSDVTEILSERIWFNNYTKFKCSIINEWNEKGLRFIADLFDITTNQLQTKEILEETFKIKMTFLCYAGIISSLPNQLKTLRTCRVLGPIIPTRMNLALNNSNFTRLAYITYLKGREHEFAQTNERQKEKWMRDVGCFDDQSFVKVSKATNSTRIKMFHYKLVNRIISTNKYLKIINVKDDDYCTFCGKETETLAHMYWFCSKVQSYIHSVKRVITKHCQIDLQINIKQWFFLTEKNGIETLIITLAKMVIHEARMKETQPTVTHFYNKLKNEEEIEHNAARLANKQDIFEKKWGQMSLSHI